MSLIDSSRVDIYLQRLEALEEHASPRWGRMSAAAMLEHLIHSLACSIGEESGGQYGPRWLGRLIRPLAMLPLPIPPGLPTTPELIALSGRSFAELKAELAALLRRVHREVLGNPLAKHAHPAFGMLDRLQWAKLQDRHLHHHFRQFRL